MLSGIGPADVLRKHSISYDIPYTTLVSTYLQYLNQSCHYNSVISDVSGVGQNLMDGSVTSIQWELPDIRYRRCTPASNSIACDIEEVLLFHF
jgi:hypothetical protein